MVRVVVLLKTYPLEQACQTRDLRSPCGLPLHQLWPAETFGNLVLTFKVASFVIKASFVGSRGHGSLVVECGAALERQSLKNAWNKLWPDLEGEKDFNDDHREMIDFVQSILGFQECDEDVETWIACDAEDCGFQTLNDDEIVTSVQEESDPADDETNEDEDNNNESSRVHQKLTRLLR
ncbi:uncharacterized protein TNCV_1369781 [Trichonephila clavipes]|nr:uncharacterized protein TNCV_1369781 [Trichonephila clavipes]